MLNCGLVSVHTGRVNHPLLKSDGSRKKYSSSGGHTHTFQSELAFFFFLNVETFRHNPSPVFKSLKHL